MAKKRMFNREIVTSDDFLELPTSTQALYLQLGVEADDDGFINKARSIARNCGASMDDINLLVETGFLLKFPAKKIYVISDWLINNNKIKADRYSETMHEEEKKQLIIESGKRYRFKDPLTNDSLTTNDIPNGTKLETNWNQNDIPNGDGMDPKNEKMETNWNQTGTKLETSWRQSGTADKNRLDKNRLDKNNTTAIYTSVNSNSSDDKGVSGENADKSTFLDPTPLQDDVTDDGKSDPEDSKNVDMTHLSKSDNAEKPQAVNSHLPELTDERLKALAKRSGYDLTASVSLLADYGYKITQDIGDRLRKAIKEGK